MGRLAVRDNNGLTPAQQDFAEAFARLGDAKKAAREAGIQERGGYRMLQLPHVAAYVEQAQRAYMTELNGIALGWARTALLSDNTSDSIKRQIASEVWKYNYGAAAPDVRAKEPHEMTADELASMIDKLRSAAAERAKPVPAADAIIDQDPAPGGVFD